MNPSCGLRRRKSGRWCFGGTPIVRILLRVVPYVSRVGGALNI